MLCLFSGSSRYHIPPARQLEGNYLGFPTLRSIASESFATPWTVALEAPLSVGFLGKNTGAGCHFLLEEIFPTQGWNPCLLCLLHCRRILNHWVTWEALLILYISRRKIDLGSDAQAYFLFPGRKQTSPESEHAQKSQHLRKEAIYLFKGATKSPLLADK